MKPSPSGGTAMAGRYSHNPAALLSGQLTEWASTGVAPDASGSLAHRGSGAGGVAERATGSGSLAGSLQYPGQDAAACGSGPAPERPRLPVTEAGRARLVLHFRLHGQDKVQPWYHMYRLYVRAHHECCLEAQHRLLSATCQAHSLFCELGVM